jgi:hypothetical protein
MFKQHIYRSLLVVAGLLTFISCSDDQSNPAGAIVPDPAGNVSIDGPTFGVSGLLFENNLVMWVRDSDGSRSELFPQMYFTRSDVSNFPVWGQFPADAVLSGGVPRDGIPSLQRPAFVSANAPGLSYLGESDLVLGAVLNGEAKAYPENILWWHEIVNDDIGGESVVMSLCPLTGTGLLMRSPSDPNTVDQLELLPVVETTWRKWQEMYPNTVAISSNTGINRNYGAYPYGNYRSENTQPLFPLQTGNIDGRFPPKHTVLGLILGDVQKAYPFSRLEDSAVANDQVNGRAVVIVTELTERLAIPYDRSVAGRTLTFERLAGAQFEMQDAETGTVWNIKGEAVSGELAGQQLIQIPAYNAFWFAWAQFWPNTEVF